MTGAERFALFLDSFASLDYRRKRAIFALLKGEADPFDRLAGMRAELCACAGEREAGALLSAARGSYADEIAERLNGRGIVPVACVSPAYPALLKETGAPPLVLYARGDLSLLSSRCFAVVGSRKSLPSARAKAAEFAEALILHGFTVVTGIAEGADSAVLHAGLSSGRVISVTAGGFDCVYPAANASLFRQVSERGLALSEHPPAVRPMAYHFPVRNRIIAGLSEGVLVVSGDEKSGTAYTAGYAADYGREVFALPYQPGIPSGRGCNRLIKNGAYLTDCIEDILSVYHIEKKERNEPALSELEQSLLALIADGVSHAERLAERAGRPVYEIMPALMQLEIKKKIVRGAGNTYAAS